MIPALELTQLGKYYDSDDHGRSVIVKDFNLSVAVGEFVCIIGHSGCGKSTVLSIVMGLNDATAGGVIVAGREVVGPGLDRGVVFQSSALLPGSPPARTSCWRSIKSTSASPARNAERWRKDIWLRLV